MYLLRRIFNCKPGEARRVASLVSKQAQAFQEAGQRSECRVYFNGLTTPSNPDTVVLEWTDEAMQVDHARRQPTSAGGEGNRRPGQPSSPRAIAIEIMELMTPDKMLDV